MPEVAAGLRRAMVTDRAPATINQYMGHARRFSTWQLENNISNVHLSKVRNLYLAHCINNNMHKSIVTIASALSYFFGVQTGGEREVESSILDSASRSAAPTQHRSKITPEHYSHIMEKAFLEESSSSLRAAALAIVLYRGMLRIGEAQNLMCSDVSSNGDTWSLHIRRSKTDQTAKGAKVVFKIPANSSESKIWVRFTESMEVGSHLPLFISQSTLVPLTISTLSSELQKLFKKADLQDFGYTTHSFRGGRASAALEAGVIGQAVMAVGRWKPSRAFQAYIRPTHLPDVS